MDSKPCTAAPPSAPESKNGSLPAATSPESPLAYVTKKMPQEADSGESSTNKASQAGSDTKPTLQPGDLQANNDTSTLLNGTDTNTEYVSSVTVKIRPETVNDYTDMSTVQEMVTGSTIHHTAQLETHQTAANKPEIKYITKRFEEK